MSQEISIADAAQTIKKARESLGLSLGDVATATKISGRILSALEEGRLGDLPAKTFSRGFVRSYAQYLKIDPQPIIEAFQLDDRFIKNMGRPDPTDANQPQPEAVKEKTELPKKTVDAESTVDWSSRAFLAAAILVLIALIVGVKYLVDKYAKERNSPPVVQTGAGEPIVSGNQQADITPSPAPTEPTPIESTAPVPLVSVTPTPTVTLAPSPTTKPSVTPTPTPLPKPTTVTASLTPAAPPSPKRSEEIIVEALDKVEIEVTLDGTPSKKITLASGSVQTFKVSKQIEIQISDGGLVNIIRNGQDIGSAGDLGRKAKVKFP